MITTDQCGRIVHVPENPKRIISLVPSQTELLYDLGLREEVCGITKFCIHPEEWFRSKTRVGGTKEVKTDLVEALQPDLILANKEENVKEQIEQLAKKWPVWVSDINNLDQALDMIRQIGRLTGKSTQADHLHSHIQSSFQSLIITDKKPQTAYLIWRDPYMTVGGDTYIHSMLELAGFDNIFKHKSRYPETHPVELRSLNCEVLLLSSEPYPFQEKHIQELQEALPDTKILLADGEMFSWYGSRLLKAPAYFQKLREKVK
jgi:ABC-type Fe3+-hydroxamate transport system substrate-binding protein